MDCAPVKVRNIRADSEGEVGIWVRADGLFRWKMTPGLASPRRFRGVALLLQVGIDADLVAK